MRRWWNGLWFSLFDQVVPLGSSLSHFVPHEHNFLIPLFPLSFLPFQPFLKFSLFYFLSLPRSSPLPSNSLTIFFPNSLFLLYPPLTPSRDAPEKLSQTPTHARITFPRSSPPWCVCVGGGGAVCVW
ncbi:hypothetical protein HOY80DRAFT_531351 [Tuber brumale]|nr:hypothetical protein HOY80DRAFT_531351 [Tuber brumale]